MKLVNFFQGVSKKPIKKINEEEKDNKEQGPALGLPVEG
jgi:hypothetical protein